MSKFNLRKSVMLICSLLSALFLCISCDKDDPAPTPDSEKHNFLFVNNLETSAYLGTFKDLSVSQVNNNDAYEHIMGVYPFVYKNIILLPEGKKGDKVHKYQRDDEGRLSFVKTLTFSQASNPGEISFVNENKAYVSLSGRGKMAIINPTTLEQTGEIDLTSYAEGDNNPDPGVTIIRDGKLYVALNQAVTQWTSAPGGYVAIIDIVSDKVDKVIINENINSIGLFRHSKCFMDEKGDIYFHSLGIAGAMDPIRSGFVRIKKGETEWDKDYLFMVSETKIAGLNEIPGNAFTFCYSSNGDAFSCMEIPSKTSNPPDYINDRNYQPVKINMYNKTIEALDIPLSTSMGAFAITKYKNEIIFGLTTTQGNGYFTYNLNSKEYSASPIIQTVGVPSDIIAFE